MSRKLPGLTPQAGVSDQPQIYAQPFVPADQDRGGAGMMPNDTPSFVYTLGTLSHQSFDLYQRANHGLYVAASGGVIIRSGDAVFDNNVSSAGIIDVDNLGVLITQGNDFSGVSLVAGAVTNAGEIASFGTSGNGITIDDRTSVDNQANGYIYGSNDGILLSGGGVVHNDSLGIIIAGGIGVEIGGGGTLFNAGEIDGGRYAAYFTNGNNRVVLYGQGVFGGVVMGGVGTNTLELAAGPAGTLSDFTSEFAHFGTIDVDSGSSWVLGAGNSVPSAVRLVDSGNLVNDGFIDASATIAGGGILTNAGTISSGDSSNPTTLLVEGGTLSNTGLIQGGPDHQAGTPVGYGVVLSGGGIVTNAGTINGGKAAIKFTGPTASKLVVDPGAIFHGTIAGGSGGNTLELAAGTASGTLSNFAGEYHGFSLVEIDDGANWVLNGTDSLGSGVAVDLGDDLSPVAQATLTNTGTINASHGILLADNALFRNMAGGIVAGGTYGVSGGSGTIINGGTIKASHAGIELSAQIALTNLTGGYIGGVVGTGTLTNAGTIATVQFSGSAADRVIVDPGAVFRDHVAGGTGANTLELAAGGVGTLSNIGLIFEHFGTLIVDAGANWTLDHTDTLDPTETVTDDGTLTNGGKIGNGVTIANGGSLFDQGQIGGPVGVSLTAGGYVGNAAGASITGNTLGIAASGLTTIVNAGTIKGGTDAITFSGTYADRLVVDPGASFLGEVVGNTNTTLELAGTGGAMGTTSTLAGTGTLFTGLSTLTVDSSADWQVAAGQTIAGVPDLSVYGTLHNAGLIDNTVTVEGAGEFDNLAKVAGNPVGVAVSALGTVTNGLGVMGASIGGQAIGVQTYGGGVFNGSGDIITGGSTGLSADGAAIVNRGTIAGGHVGVYLNGGASLSSVYGGSIRGTGMSSTGVVLYGSGTITNGGTISGTEAAIALQGNGLDRLIERAGAVLKGAVSGGTANDTLELAQGQIGVTGTVSRFATAFSGFGTLAVDAGADWSFDRTNTIASLVTLSVAGTLANAGVIQTLASIVGGGTLTNTGSIGLGVELGAQPLQGAIPPGTATLDNLAGGTITGGPSSVSTALEAAAQITNAGLISSPNTAVSLEAGGTVTNLAGGSILATSSGGVGISTIGAAVTVVNAGTISAGYAAVELKGTNANRVVADAGSVFHGLVFGGGPQSTLELAAGAAATGTITNLEDQYSGFGTLSVDDGANWVLDGEGFAGAVVDSGVLAGTDGTVDLGAVSGTGTLSAAAGAVLDLQGGGSFNGALSGAGTVQIGSALTLGPAASLSASTVLDTATVQTSANLTNAAGDSFILSAASGATVALGSHAAGGSLANAGTLTGSGEGTEAVGSTVNNTGIVSVSAGTLSFLGAVTDTGVMDAAAGVLSFASSVSGIGTLEVGATGTLSLLGGAGPGQAVDFLAGTGLLDLKQSSILNGTISGFGGSDAIDLLQTRATSLSYSGGVLTISSGSSHVADLNLAGSFTTAGFALGSDGHGGALITLH